MAFADRQTIKLKNAIVLNSTHRAFIIGIHKKQVNNCMLYKCDLCNSRMETDEDLSGEEVIICPHCGIETRVIPVNPFSKPPVQTATITDHPDRLEEHMHSNPTRSAADLEKAEQLHLQATFRLNECQAHYKVFGSRLGKQARDGLEFIEAALALFPDNPKYLNVKALLLADGLGKLKQSADIFQQARRIAPSDIQIRQNLRDAKQAIIKSRIITVTVVVLTVLIMVGLIVYLSKSM